MFEFFKKRSQLDVLAKKYTTLLKEAHELSTVDRTESDRKMAEAEELGKVIDDMKQAKQ
jgi:hypothetical protein